MDPQQSFLGRHGFVIAAVTLPILVVVGFGLARALPRLLVEDPRHDLVFSAVKSHASAPRHTSCDLAAVDGRVRVRWSRLEEAVYTPTLGLYRLRPATGDLQELEVPEPADLSALQGTLDLFLDLQDARIDTSPRAPDGYEFEISYGGGSGLLGELFFHGWHGPRSTVAKGGRVISVPQPTPEAGYASVTFLGWALAGEGRR